MDKTLLNQKKVAKSLLTRLKKKTLGELNELDVSQLNVRRNRFNVIGEDLKNIFNKLLSACSEEEIDKICEEKEELDEIIDDMLTNIDRAILKFENKGVEPIQSGSKQISKPLEANEIKLPTLSLPTFSGSVEEWLTFSDLFQAAVTTNKNLSSAQKLQYLKGVLKSDALKVVQSLSITDNNFKIAWELLTERYFHKREILSSLMKKFLSLPSLSTESHTQILNLVDSSKEFVRMIEALELKVDKTADTLIMFIVQFKLDPSTRSWWERSLKSDEIPSLEALLQFLSNHARSIGSGIQYPKGNPSKKITLLASEIQQCPICQGNHVLCKCDAFQKLSVQKRVDFVKSKGICFNCLNQFHRASSCKSKFKCRKCQKSHHTLLHFTENREIKSTQALSANARAFTPRTAVVENVLSEEQPRDSTQESLNPVISSCVSDCYVQNLVLLCTAVVDVKDAKGEKQRCRVLLDPGSQANFITEECFHKLGLSRKRASFSISCLGSANARTNGVSHITFVPHFSSSVSYTTSVFILSKIIGDLPQISLSEKAVESYKDLKLADPTFHRKGPIDILLGVEFLPVLTGQKLKSVKDETIAVHSELGWIISGKVPLSELNASILVNNIQLCNLDKLVSDFWKLEAVPTVSLLTDAEKKCEHHFESTHTRDGDGRYIVRLPFHSQPMKLGDSRQIALRRFKSLELSLSADPAKYENYRKFMREYLTLGHMEPVPQEDYAKRNKYYLPHHAVLREASTTTKLRVVFDASSKSSSGYSLNDLLMVGPRLQPDLYPILLNFRLFKIAVHADLEKMFRQIKVHPDDVDWQRILWRETSEENVKEYRLVIVTYGTVSAPYLSTRTLQQLAVDEGKEYPLASHATLHQFYVDDLLSGADSVEDAQQLVNQLNEMMKKGGFNLRKWHSNVPAIFRESSVSDEDHDVCPIEDSEVKVLGIMWSPKSDSFRFTVAPTEGKSTFSKREVLSELSRVFDPLGFLSPCVIFMKTLLQELWKLKLTWDEPIPESLCEKWKSFRKELPLIEQLQVPRYILQPQWDELELHAFCDASEKAYCCVLYLRCVTSNSDISVSLLTSKTRVAPLKTQSLPRLELCSALLLSNVVTAVLKELQISIQKTFAWSDSTITLSWLSSEPYRWQSFVANRVSKIQTTVPFIKWQHVCGSENPADLGTRGLLPSELISCDKWLHGPQWLREPLGNLSNFTAPDTSLFDSVQLEEKRVDICVNNVVVTPEFITKISSFTKLIRVCAWIKRFVHNNRTKTSRLCGPLSSRELYSATINVVRVIQEAEFFRERRFLSEGKPLPSNSKLLPLNVFLDEDNILRVGGRLSNHSSLSYENKHPMLLPKNHEFTRGVIDYYHCANLHAGPQLTLSLIRQRFWFVDGRSVVRNQLRRCVRCFKLNLRKSNQIMGNLPNLRIEQIRPFGSTGIDFAGPLTTKCAHKRSVMKFKSYICLFICTTTKAIHLEAVSELSTAAFLAALRRFISRRGCPAKITTDNGSNFKGASTHLKNLLQLCRSQEVQDFSSTKGIDWSFIPPYTPHFGGLWESGIKSTKQLLTKTCNTALLNFEEFCTLLTQIEACLNSRPLTELSSDPSDLNAITPAHFLIGGQINQFPEPSQPTKVTSLSERWSLIQRLRKHFWDRWNTEYLHQLQPRSKWWKSTPNLKVGDLVIVHKENAAPLTWNLGRITNINPGSDNKVRVVTVNTKNGEVTRSVNKIYLLPIAT